MDDLLSEKEQIEQLRSWWSEYGGYVIGGLGLGIAILVGLNYYTSARLDAQLKGSVLYESLTQHVVSGDLDEAAAVADELAIDYAKTSYAAQAQLAMARLYMDKNRDQDAADALSQVIASDADEEVKLVARARLARILLYQNKAQDVVDLLEGQPSESFAAVYQELLGDAYHALGRIEDAQAAYQNVMLDPLSAQTVDQQLVQWKALDLPETSAPVDVAEDADVLEPAADEAVEATEAEDTE
ncbi:MAG: tetratricopeptide repeat protein [Gammaproteobacteria bacterium]|nr:tetratricopeptide repeat protein [Gammaproteobacteria bacterium]MDH5618375.1 tetratricopeptide repeat protein [Gammaproteobacteria bacterium]